MKTIKVINAQDYSKWEKYVEEIPAAGFFHRIGWLKVVQRTYGHRPFYLMATSGETVHGILPLFLVSSPMFGRILASDVFTSYGGICADDAEVERQLMDEAARLAMAQGVSYLEIKNLNRINGLNGRWQTKTDYCTLILDLQPGAEQIWKAWRDKTRNDVRKATKSGVVIEQGAQFFDEFYKLVTVDMRRLGTPVHSRKFYYNILQEFPEEANIFVAKVSGQTVSAALTVGFKKHLQAYTSVSLSEFRQLKPNALLYWEVVQYACQRGYHYLDFGRSTWESGTFEFKKHLGAAPVPLYYDYYLNRRKTVPHIHQDNKNYRLAIAVWQRLPLAVTRALGPHLIKYVV
ncbi:MAG: FemAB family PEP-CTERM system-associated protein [candidate division KSB1 bacterium]|nr:FemAB family PEP-CTERM system-associated protein [candidate division KSB1 bacterium]